MRHPTLHIDYFNDFPLTLDSAESIHIYEICKQFEELGCKVRLFSPTPPNPFDANFNLIPVHTPRFLKSIFYQLCVIPITLRYWFHDKPDAIYMRISPFLFIPALLARLCGIPLYVEINGTLHLELKQANTRLCQILLLFRITDTIERFVYSHAKQIITVTDTLKSYLVSRFYIAPSKILVVSNGVDANRLRPLSTKSTQQKITIGYIGGLMRWQGLEYVLDAFALKKSALRNARLVIYGDGPERDKLIEQAHHLDISNQIDFPGRVSLEQVAGVINSFDICIAYYVRARAGLNSPFKVYEYLACGKPVIVSDIKGIGDTFSAVAEVTTAENSKALANTMVMLAKNTIRRKQLSLAAREYILDSHTWQDSAQNIVKLISDTYLDSHKYYTVRRTPRPTTDRSKARSKPEST